MLRKKMAEASPQTITTAKNLRVDNSNADGDWTVVVPRRGKQKRRSNTNTETIEHASIKETKKEAIEPAAWAPTDLETDPEKESKLMQKMETCITKLENSDFYRTFLDQIQTEEILKYFTSVLASEPKMQMVIYGIGSIDSYEIPRVQLALAILIKRKFEWIGGIEVFDPVISTTESKVLEALGCSVLLVNEEGRRQALKPTLFFMPHCEAVLYDNLLEANWKPEFLKRMVVFGNSFSKYTEYMCEFKGLVHFDYAKHVVGIQKFSKEVELETVSDEYFRAFHDSSLHFFNQNPEMELELNSIQL